jgi:hypothetical protein
MIELCGRCLHNKLAHTPHNGHFMYCAKCQSLCDILDYEKKYSPTPIEEVMRIGVLKQ